LLNCYVFSVLKYACESWTMNSTLMKRIDAFEQWFYRRMLKISWTDKVTNDAVLAKMKESKLHFADSIMKQKLSYAGHVLKGSSGKNAMLILEGKFERKEPRGRPRRMWIDDVLQKLDKTKYQEVKRLAEDSKTWRKMTHQPSYREDGN